LNNLEWYWFDKILYGVRNQHEFYDKITSNLEPFDRELSEEEGLLKIGAITVARLPVDRNKFVSAVMDLVRDYEIWMSILSLVRAREEIGDKIQNFTRQLDNLVNEINNDRYHITLECCPSQQIPRS
jgi:hypothetical protein